MKPRKVYTKKFERALRVYIQGADRLVKARWGEDKSVAEAPRRSKRFIKIVVLENGEMKEAFAFIEINTGDVLMPASWSSPALHARGNIFADDPLDGTGPYGPGYIAKHLT